MLRCLNGSFSLYVTSVLLLVLPSFVNIQIHDSDSDAIYVQSLSRASGDSNDAYIIQALAFSLS